MPSPERRPRPRPEPAPDAAPLKERNRRAIRVVFELAREHYRKASRNTQSMSRAVRTLEMRGAPTESVAAVAKWWCERTRCHICGGIIPPHDGAWDKPISYLFGLCQATCGHACRAERISRSRTAQEAERAASGNNAGEDLGVYLPLPEEIEERLQEIRKANPDFAKAAYCDRQDDPYPHQYRSFRYDSDHPSQVQTPTEEASKQHG